MVSLKNLFAVLILCFTATLANAQEKLVTYAQLPAKAQTFIKTHYSQKDVLHAIEETEYLVKKEYKVVLKNNIKLEFDKNGEWKEVAAERSAIPKKIVPVSINQYVAKNFPNTHICQIKKDSGKFEIELSSGLDVEFNSKGEFLRIDN